MKQYMYLCVRAMLLWLMPAMLAAQSVSFSIKGTVTDERGEPLVGAVVSLAERRVGTSTDLRGFYALEGVAPEGTYTLTVSYVGYTTYRMPVTIRQGQPLTQDISLNSDILNLDEVIVTGNSPTATRKQLGNAIGVVDGRSLEKAGSNNTLGALAGKVAGAQISQNSGDPGGGFTIRLRGVSSVKGSSDPLYIVDGVIVDNSSQNVINRSADAMTVGLAAGQNRLIDINPNDIERIEVLNGASAAALYGSRASNGVVQIFTKRGRSGKPVIEFSTSASIASCANGCSSRNTLSASVSRATTAWRPTRTA